MMWVKYPFQMSSLALCYLQNDFSAFSEGQFLLQVKPARMNAKSHPRLLFYVETHCCHSHATPAIKYNKCWKLFKRIFPNKKILCHQYENAATPIFSSVPTPGRSKKGYTHIHIFPQKTETHNVNTGNFFPCFLSSRMLPQPQNTQSGMNAENWYSDIFILVTKCFIP